MIRYLVLVLVDTLLLSGEYAVTQICGTPVILFCLEMCLWLIFVRTGNDLKIAFEHLGWLLLIQTCGNTGTLLLFSLLIPLMCVNLETAMNLSRSRNAQVSTIAKLCVCTAGCFFLLDHMRLQTKNYMPLLYLVVQVLMYKSFDSKVHNVMKVFCIMWLVMCILSSSRETDDFLLHIDATVSIICFVNVLLCTLSFLLQKYGSSKSLCPRALPAVRDESSSFRIGDIIEEDEEDDDDKEKKDIRSDASNSVVHMTTMSSEGTVHEQVDKLWSNQFALRNISVVLFVALHTFVEEHHTSPDIILVLCVLIVLQISAARLTLPITQSNTILIRFSSLINLTLLITLYLGLFYLSFLESTGTREIRIPYETVRNQTINETFLGTTTLSNELSKWSKDSNWQFYRTIQLEENDPGIISTDTNSLLSYMSCAPLKPSSESSSSSSSVFSEQLTNRNRTLSNELYADKNTLLFCVYRRDYDFETWIDACFVNMHSLQTISVSPKFAKLSDPRLVYLNDELFILDRTNHELSIVELNITSHHVQVGRQTKIYIRGELTTPFTINGVLYIMDLNANSLYELGQLYHALYTGTLKVSKTIPIRRGNNNNDKSMSTPGINKEDDTMKSSIRDGSNVFVKKETNELCSFATQTSYQVHSDPCCVSSQDRFHVRMRPIKWCLNTSSFLFTKFHNDDTNDMNLRYNNLDDNNNKYVEVSLNIVPYHWDQWIVEPTSTWENNGTQVVLVSSSDVPRSLACLHRECYIKSVVFVAIS